MNNLVLWILMKSKQDVGNKIPQNHVSLVNFIPILRIIYAYASLIYGIGESF